MRKRMVLAVAIASTFLALTSRTRAEATPQFDRTSFREVRRAIMRRYFLEIRDETPLLQNAWWSAEQVASPRLPASDGRRHRIVHKDVAADRVEAEIARLAQHHPPSAVWRAAATGYLRTLGDKSTALDLPRAVATARPTCRRLSASAVYLGVPALDADALKFTCGLLLALPHASDPTQTLIIDLRDTQAGTLDAARRFCGFFCGRSPLVLVRGRQSATLAWTVGPRICKWPLIVLVNQNTRGPAEVVSACLRDAHRAVLAGTPTCGDARMRTTVSLHGAALTFTSADFFTSRGERFDRLGLDVDLSPGVPINTAASQQDAAIRQVIELVHAKPVRTCKIPHDFAGLSGREIIDHLAQDLGLTVVWNNGDDPVHLPDVSAMTPADAIRAINDSRAVHLKRIENLLLVESTPSPVDLNSVWQWRYGRKIISDPLPIPLEHAMVLDTVPFFQRNFPCCNFRAQVMQNFLIAYPCRYLRQIRQIINVLDRRVPILPSPTPLAPSGT